MRQLKNCEWSPRSKARVFIGREPQRRRGSRRIRESPLKNPIKRGLRGVPYEESFDLGLTLDKAVTIFILVAYIHLSYSPELDIKK